MLGLVLCFLRRGEGVLCLVSRGVICARGGLSQREKLEAGVVGCELRTAGQSLLPGARSEPGIASRLGEAGRY